MILSNSTIKNIIFDLGGVVMNLRFDRLISSFNDLGITIDPLNEMNDYSHWLFMEDFETGKLSPKEFYANMRKAVNKDISDQQIDVVFNSVLGEVPNERVALLNKLKKYYSIYLFSNTNQINEDSFYPRLKKQFGYDIFTELFEESFMSHHIGYRKPSLEAFQYIIQKRGLKPEETVFVDDILSNVEGAKKAGIHAIHLEPGKDIQDLFTEKFEIIL